MEPTNHYQRWRSRSHGANWCGKRTLSVCATYNRICTLQCRSSITLTARSTIYLDEQGGKDGSSYSTPKGRSLLLVLEVSHTGEAAQQLGIIVQKPSGGSVNQVVRHDALGLIKVSQDMVQSAELNTAFLCKKIPYAINISPLIENLSTLSNVVE
jgi:hypothetical protein